MKQGDQMQFEVERKYRLYDCDSLRHKLVERGAIIKGEECIEDTYFKIPVGVTGSSVLRLRESSDGDTGGGELTWKGPPRNSVKELLCRSEVGVHVADIQAMGAILEALGARVVARVAKCRERYLLRNVPVFIDHVRDIGDFVEIGGPVDESGIAEMSNLIHRLGSELGLVSEASLQRSYLQLVLDT